MTILKEAPTNDFDLQKEKQSKFSTIKTQKKNAKNIIERTIDLQKIKVNLMFDRLKICVDLHSHGKEIDFKLGENMKQSNYPYLPSYKQLLIAQKETTPVDIESFLKKITNTMKKCYSLIVTGYSQSEYTIAKHFPRTLAIIRQMIDND